MKRKIEKIIQESLVCDAAGKAHLGKVPFCPYYANKDYVGIDCQYLGNKIDGNYHVCLSPSSRLRTINVERRTYK